MEPVNEPCLGSTEASYSVLCYFPGSDPGTEYEILSDKDLDYTLIQRGEAVTVKCGVAKLHGIVVSISEDVPNLKLNYDSLVEEHRKQAMEEELRLREPTDDTQIRTYIKEGHASEATQTEPDSSDMKYKELLKTYENLKKDYDKFTSVISAVKTGLNDSMVKLEIVDPKEDDKTVYNHAKFRNNRLKRAALRNLDDNKENGESSNSEITIGPEGTKVPVRVYNSINWSSYTAATRKLLVTLFPRSVLATHSLTGKPSPAFLDRKKQTKERLNPNIISDIVQIVSRKCKVTESLVRNAVTTKCADENKLHKKRLVKKECSSTEDE